MEPAPGFLRSHLTKLPYPTKKFTGQTIIVTGSNTGMGLEAARHFVRLDAETVILAVRSIPKGEAAKASIEASEKRDGVVEVWELDLAEYASVKRFAARVQSQGRLDVLVGNAGVYHFDFAMAEDNEQTITVNVVSTFLLSLLLIPKLRETAVAHKKTTVLTLTGSFVHFTTKFPEQKNANIFESLNEKKTARLSDRYNVSKLIGLLCLRELATKLSESSKEGQITVSTINPGFVDTEIMREASCISSVFLWVLKKSLSRSAEEGGRTLVSAAEGGDETHGAYLNDCKPGEPSEFVRSDEGAKIQKQLWKELAEKLEKIQPGVMANI